MKHWLLAGVLLAGVLVWLLYPRPYDWGLADGDPVPEVPANNPMSATKVELGRHLFYDTRLSINGTFSSSRWRSPTDERARSAPPAQFTRATR